MKSVFNKQPWFGHLLILSALAVFVGCDQAPTESDTTAQAEHDHGHSHDHGDEHDHEDGHDHGEHGHDEHGGHDHGEHGDDEHDHEGPESFAEALASVTSMKTTICKAFADETPDAAHDELHEIGHLLEEIPELAAKVDGISKEQIAKVEAAVEKLFEGFGELDHTLHDTSAEVDVAALEKQLTDAISELESATK